VARRESRRDGRESTAVHSLSRRQAFWERLSAPLSPGLAKADYAPDDFVNMPAHRYFFFNLFEFGISISRNFGITITGGKIYAIISPAMARRDRLRPAASPANRRMLLIGYIFFDGRGTK